MPVLAEGRQTVAFCGPQPPARIVRSISAPVDDCGNCGQAVCKNFRIASNDWSRISCRVGEATPAPSDRCSSRELTPRSASADHTVLPRAAGLPLRRRLALRGNRDLLNERQREHFMPSLRGAFNRSSILHSAPDGSLSEV